MDKKELGKNIKSIRQKKLFSREYICEKVGISIHTLAKYEQGQREPNINMLDKLANALEVSKTDLLGIEKKVYDLTDILSKNEGKSINNPTTEEKERLKKTIELAGKISSDVINKINDEALDGMIAIGRYSSLDDEMEILKKATDKQIENILDSLGKQLEFELFKLKNDIENKK